MRARLDIAGAGLALLFAFVFAPAARALDVPPLRGHVNDYANILPADRAQALEARLAAYEQRTGQQFALLTVPTLAGDSIEDFSIRVAEQWKVGHKGEDDGLILLIVPQDHKMRVEVGYGLEGTVPDAIAARVVREVLAPAFQQGDFAGGIDSAFGALMHAASGGREGAEPAPAPVERSARRRAPSVLGFLPFLLFILFALLGGGGRGRRRRRYGGFWIGPSFGGGFGGGGFGGGGFGGGGGGGGGFRGGGGGFGGGGASGSW